MKKRRVHKRYADNRRILTPEERAEQHEVRKRNSGYMTRSLKLKCSRCLTVQEVGVAKPEIYTEKVRESWVCPYCRHGICKPQDAAKAKLARIPKAKKEAKPRGPRPASGESILIEMMLRKPCSKEELAAETGLSANSIKMYTNGYLERVRHKPYRIEESKGRYLLVELKEA